MTDTRVTDTLAILEAAFGTVLDDDRARALSLVAGEALNVAMGGRWRTIAVDPDGFDIDPRPRPTPDHAEAREALADALGPDAYDCTRVWEAWSYGTMSDADFVSIAGDDERLEELVNAVAAVLAVTQTTGLPVGLIGQSDADDSGRTLNVLVCAEHQPRQHRDGKPPWCQACGRTAKGTHHNDLGILGMDR